MNQTLTDARILQSVAAQAAVAQAPAAPPVVEKPAQSTAEWVIPGFCGKSKVLTSFGNLPIEALRKNDPLKTAAGKFRKVTWVDKVTFEPEFLASHPEAQPVLMGSDLLTRWLNRILSKKVTTGLSWLQTGTLMLVFQATEN